MLRQTPYFIDVLTETVQGRRLPFAQNIVPIGKFLPNLVCGYKEIAHLDFTETNRCPALAVGEPGAHSGCLKDESNASFP